MEIDKYNSSTQIKNIIAHNIRQLEEGRSYKNENVDPRLSENNYSLIDRGKTVEEVNKYRKDFEDKCFKYKRKNVVHAMELVIQCPSDCPQEYHRAFFETSFNWYCENYLPAGMDSVFVASVHTDEHKYVKALENGKEVIKDISKEHLHIMAVPAVKAGAAHKDFEYRLCADQLTKRAVLKSMHPSLQEELKKHNIPGTVFQKKEGDGKAIKLSVDQLKDITDRTGVVIEKSLTVDNLVDILKENQRLHSFEIESQKIIDGLKEENSALKKDLEKTIDNDWGRSDWDVDRSW